MYDVVKIPAEVLERATWKVWTQKSKLKRRLPKGRPARNVKHLTRKATGKEQICPRSTSTIAKKERLPKSFQPSNTVT